MGGTEILNPLKKAVDLNVGKRKKRVFLLTDGEVNNSKEIIDFAKLHAENVRIHTFGVGRDCDKKLIEGIALAGRGSFSYAVDSRDNLSGLVI